MNVSFKNKDVSCYIQIREDHTLKFLDLNEMFQQATPRSTKREFFEENAIVGLQTWPTQ